MLRISPRRPHDIKAEQQPVSAEVALRFSKLFGNASLFWIRMQGGYAHRIQSKLSILRRCPPSLGFDGAVHSVDRASDA